MTRSVKYLALVLGSTFTFAAGAAAQTTTPPADTRVFVSINGVFQSSATSDFEEVQTFSLYGENTGRIATDSSIESGGSGFDVSVGYRVWGNVAVGVGFSRASNTGTAETTASVPHPLFFNANREASATDELNHQESAVHLQARYLIPVTEQVEVTVFGGPSFFKLRQEVVSDANFSEVGPPSTAVNLTTTVAERGKNKVGVNIGVDAAYMFTRNVGAGLFARYAGTSIDIQTATGTESIKVGGGQFGIGARLRF